MKISKVDHRKTAVGVIKSQGTRGIIYQDPTREKTNVEQIVNNRTRSTKILYNIFDEGKLKKNVSAGAKKLAKDVNVGIKTLKQDKRHNHSEEITNKLSTERLLKALTDANKYNNTYKASVIDEALDNLLKKTLKSQDSKEALRILLMAAYGNNKEAALSPEDSQKIKDAFISKFVNDYSKASVIANTPKALKNQNMVVQPGKDNHVVLPSQNRHSSERKMNEKEALRSFLLAYSVIDEKERQDLRIKLRRLIDLYFYGADKVISTDFDEWKLHNDRKNENEPFACVFKNSVQKKDKTIEVIDVDATKAAFRDKNIECYRRSMQECANHSDIYFEESWMNKFWIHFIENEVEKLYTKINEETEQFRFTTGYISEKTWKGIINYLSIKYIAIGKAVYNFALGDISKNSGTINLGNIDDKFIDGISSFEYERIKAEETLQREAAVAVSFAANNLSHATINTSGNDTDILVMGKDTLAKLKKDNIKRNILQFFGGQSSWNDFSFDAYLKDGYDELDYLKDLKDIIYSLRNATFHFTTENNNSGDWNTALIGSMFEYDCHRAGTVIKNKFYSNNLLMFYSDKALEDVLHKLYDNYSERASQVPSFNSVFSRSNFPTYLKENGIDPKMSSEDKDKLFGALYYLYKEIYYNAFLQAPEALDLFKKSVSELKTDIKDEKGKLSKEALAHKDFKDAIKHYDNNSSFSDICQMIMTEYNMQNAGGRKKKSSYASKIKPEIFQHYKMILYKVIQEAFTSYIKNDNAFDFIKNPTVKNDIVALEKFLPDFKTGQYLALINSVKKNPELQKWYIMSRFLNNKQTNQLIGSFRSYVQYVNDVKRRAKETGNKLRDASITIEVDSIIQILDVSSKLNGSTSNNLEDYFDNKDEYAKYIALFLDFGLKESDEFASAKLGEFCKREVDGRTIGIYHDGTNPILNRNIILSKLYGAAHLISNCIDPIGEVEIKKMYKLDASLGSYKETRVCKTKDEQISLKKYQELRNRVEFRDVIEYAEILNELQGQLVNWSYLRERDLMYFQLGFHYLCLNNASKKATGYTEITHNGKTIKGAILHQVIAMYTNGVPLYHYDKDGNVIDNILDKKERITEKSNALVPTGAKLGYFGRYSNALYHDEDVLYTAGLELFEYIPEHDNITNLRNYIDHFKFFTDNSDNRSMLDIYSEVFDRFFSYDMKYRKNVPNMLYNILLGHFVVASFTFSSGKKIVGVKKDAHEKERASIKLRAKNGLSSDKFTFKLSGGETIELTAKSTAFLKNVAALICFPENPPIDVVRNAEGEDRNSKTTKSNVKESKGNQGSKPYKSQNKRDNSFDASKLDRNSVGNGFNFDPSILDQIKKKEKH